jgi:hypothetical protein
MISLSGALLLEVIFFSMFLNSRSNMTKEAVADGTYYQAHRLVHFGSDHRIRPASGLTYVRFLSGDVQVTLFAEMLASSPHIDIDRLVDSLIEGSHLSSGAQEHLLKCVHCTDALLVVMSRKLRRPHEPGWCDRRENLRREWQDAVEVYIRTLVEVIRKTNTVPELELVKLGKITEAARKIAALLRSELNDHIATHGCNGADSSTL